MDSLSKEYIIDFFSKKLSFFGNTPAAVGWSKTGQRQRYECIEKMVSLEGSTVLDFGCGKGDFYGFLREKVIAVNYTGADINPKLIETASKKYPETRFISLDIDSDEVPGTFDFVILCGVFNLNIEGVRESVGKYLQKLFTHTTRTLIFNCLGTHSKTSDINLIYFEPEELLSIAKDITGYPTLHHALIEGDLFLLLNR